MTVVTVVDVREVEAAETVAALEAVADAEALGPVAPVVVVS